MKTSSCLPGLTPLSHHKTETWLLSQRAWGEVNAWQRDEHMNVKLNMKDINKISTKEDFKCIFLMIRRKSTFLRKCVSIKLLEVSLSCIHFPSCSLREKSVKHHQANKQPWIHTVSRITNWVLISQWIFNVSRITQLLINVSRITPLLST
jgi:hypothetical protein